MHVSRKETKHSTIMQNHLLASSSAQFVESVNLKIRDEASALQPTIPFLCFDRFPNTDVLMNLFSLCSITSILEQHRHPHVQKCGDGRRTTGASQMLPG